MKKKSIYKPIKEFPRPFNERFWETYSNCPPGHVVVLCGCGNTFHKKNWERQQFCSQACIYRYSKNETKIFKEAFTLAS